MNNPKYTTDLMPKLPKLPVPDLDITLSSLKEWSTPLLSAKEFADLDATIDQFAKSDGPILQQRLEKWLTGPMAAGWPRFGKPVI